MIGLSKGVVILAPHDNTWHDEYEKEKQRLQTILGDLALDIQHVGSTSLPVIKAKPIIDIAVGVKDRQTVLEALKILEGYPEYDTIDSIKNEDEVLVRLGPTTNRTHYIHIEVYNSYKWEEHIVFRDYMRTHPEDLQKYQEIKVYASEAFKNERKKYTAYKDEFIKGILAKAKAELKNQ